jgi:hypothetical protein
MTNMIVSCYSCAAQGAKASTATVVALALVPWAIQQQIRLFLFHLQGAKASTTDILAQVNEL